MKKLAFLFNFFLVIQSNVFAQCGSGSHTVTGNQTIAGSCKINGDLTLLNGATLNVDLSAAGADTFIVQGNILLQGNAILWVHSAPSSTVDQFIVSNTTNNQRTITTKNSSKIQLEHIEFRTQEGNLSSASSYYMNYNAHDSSMFYVNKSRLNTQTAWILFNMKDKATFIGFEPDHVPTEMYIQDSSKVVLHGPNTHTGIWLNFESIVDTLNLPPNQTAPFSYKIGKGVGGLATPWYLQMDTVLSGLGVQVYPSTKLTVNGAGFPTTGELKVALMFANNTDTLKNLQVGIQNTTITSGPAGYVHLNNVNLGPIAWQIYALMNENLFIKNSVINEIGIAGPSQVKVDNSLLQLAVIAAIGVGGSTMIINNSELWNQEITAFNNSDIVLNNCKVYGSMFKTSDAFSSITVNGGCFFQNPTGCSPANMVNINSGQPYCNPFIPPGFPQNLSPSTVTFNGVNSNCPITGIKEENTNLNITVYPNPSSNIVYINATRSVSISIYSIDGKILLANQGKSIDISNLPNGLYFLEVMENNSSRKFKIIKN